MLRISGINLDVDLLLEQIYIEPEKVYRKGEIRSGKRKYKNSGIYIETSPGHWNNLSVQIEDTIRFIRKHQLELSIIRDFEGVEIISLDFGINSGISDENVAVQTDRFPLQLIQLAAKFHMEIELTQYWEEEEEGERKSDSEDI